MEKICFCLLCSFVRFVLLFCFCFLFSCLFCFVVVVVVVVVVFCFISNFICGLHCENVLSMSTCTYQFPPLFLSLSLVGSLAKRKKVPYFVLKPVLKLCYFYLKTLRIIHLYIFVLVFDDM